MSINIEYPSQFVEADTQNYTPFDDIGGLVMSAPECYSQQPVDVSEMTRKVWHDYLAQYDVTSAIMTVTLPAPHPRCHAFLIGFDAVRKNPRATKRLLSVAEQLWTRLGHQSVFQFQISGTNLACDGISGDDECMAGADILGKLDHAIAAQTQHNGANIRAVYFRQKDLGRFSRQDVGSLQLILPLFADSAAGGAQLARQSQRSAMLEAMFDRVSLSMAMLTAEGQPLFMNSSAVSMIEERKWLIRCADGSITCTNPKQAKELRESIRLAATATKENPTEEVYRLDCANGEWRLAYVVSAVSRSADVTTRCAMLIVLAPGKMDAPTQMLEALGLLPSEQRFLGHFLKSSSLGNAAVDCGLSEETARTYLKRVRAKLGVHRQMELAGLLSGLVLPLHAASYAGAGD